MQWIEKSVQAGWRRTVECAGHLQRFSAHHGKRHPLTIRREVAPRTWNWRNVDINDVDFNDRDVTSRFLTFHPQTGLTVPDALTVHDGSSVPRWCAMHVMTWTNGRLYPHRLLYRLRVIFFSLHLPLRLEKLVKLGTWYVFPAFKSAAVCGGSYFIIIVALESCTSLQKYCLRNGATVVF